MKFRDAFFALLIISLLVAIFFIMSNKDAIDSSFIGNVISDLRNCKDVKIPYETTEEYEYYPKAEVVDTYIQDSVEVSGKGVYKIGKASVRNIDNEAGWFTLVFKWKTSKNNWTDSVRHYIEPDEVIEFASEYDVSLGKNVKLEYNYNSDSILKTKTVTKYRTEKKCA